MATVIQNACIVNLDPPAVRRGDIRIEGDTISDVADQVTTGVLDTIVDAGGCVVLPGLVNGHHHLYSALAVGMPAPARAPQSFSEILELVWWRLDRALDLPTCEISAVIGGIDALRCGVTTVIDHHASPSCIPDSLDAIEAGLRRVGLRGVLAYETTDRHGNHGAREGLAENERYLTHCVRSGSNRFAGMVGGHAAFTMSDDTLAGCAALAKRYQTGVHLHAAEDACDDTICREHYGAPLIDRLERAGVLETESLLAHGTELSRDDLARLSGTQAWFAHNPRSNMNNQVGYAPVHTFDRPVLLGTDGIGSDMLAELQTAWFASRNAGVAIAPDSFVAMLAAGAERAGQLLGTTIGTLAPGAAADLVLTDAHPATPITSDNLAGHLVFGLSSRHVRSVMIAGQWRLKDRRCVDLDEHDLRHRAMTAARGLWQRMSEL